jgi:hypothetical protein
MTATVIQLRPPVPVDDADLPHFWFCREPDCGSRGEASSRHAAAFDSTAHRKWRHRDVPGDPA